MKNPKKGSNLPIRLVCAVLSCLLLIGVMAVGTAAEERAIVFPSGSSPTKVYLDGREVLAGECILYDSITYVPLRNFCNLLDSCKFSWNGSTATATVTTENLTLHVQNNALYIVANGHYFYTVGKIMNLQGHMYVPIRPLAKAFAEDLEWNASARRVELTKIGRAHV